MYVFDYSVENSMVRNILIELLRDLSRNYISDIYDCACLPDKGTIPTVSCLDATNKFVKLLIKSR